MLTVCIVAVQLQQERVAERHADIDPVVVRALKAVPAAAATRTEVGAWKCLTAPGVCQQFEI